MSFDKGLVADRIKDVVLQDSKLPERVARDIAFHMTDWLDELARYSAFCADPDKMTNQEVKELLLAFLTHAPNHIAAAAKLYAQIPVTDVFGVGATSEDSRKQPHD